jgi:adenylylsulfate kinase
VDQFQTARWITFTPPASQAFLCRASFDYSAAMAPQLSATTKRSVVKAITYRALIVALDFAVIYLLTGKAGIAAGFMVVSNIYTTIGYFVHERIWARVQWGQAPKGPSPA